MTKRVTNAELVKIRTQLKAKQGGKCAMCKTTFTRNQVACVDHCHDTGVIRGVLCRNCNRAEGKIRTIAVSCKRMRPYFEWLKDYMRYMIIHQTPQTTWIHPKFKTDAEKRNDRNYRARLRYAKRNGNPIPKRPRRSSGTKTGD